MKRITSVLLASVLLLGTLTSLVACGTTEETESESMETSEEVPVSDTVSAIINSETSNIDNDIAKENSTEKIIKSRTKKLEYGDGTSVELTEYDKNGNIIEDNTGEYTYDDFGNLIKVECGNDVAEYTYDQNGNVLTSTFYKEEELDSWSEYTYDNNGNILSEINHNNGVGINYHYEYIYDENENVIKQEFYGGWPEEKLFNIYEYTYDENGNELTRASWFIDGDKYLADYYRERMYDDNNNMLSNIIYEQDYTESILTNYIEWNHQYTYDEDGNMLSESIYSAYSADSEDISNNLDSWTEYTYDQDGNVLSETAYNKDGSMQSKYVYEYEYY